RAHGAAEVAVDHDQGSITTAFLERCEFHRVSCVGNSALLRVEMLVYTLPAFEIVALQLRRFQCLARRYDDCTRFEHECHRIDDVIRLRGIGATGLLECGAVRAMPRHAVVQAATSR